MAKANENSVIIDNKEYKESELSDKQKYFATQVNSLKLNKIIKNNHIIKITKIV